MINEDALRQAFLELAQPGNVSEEEAGRIRKMVHAWLALADADKDAANSSDGSTAESLLADEDREYLLGLTSSNPQVARLLDKIKDEAKTERPTEKPKVR